MSINTQEKFLARPVSNFYMLIISTGALVFLGLIMVFSASSIHSIDTNGSVISIVLRQLLFVCVAVPFAIYLARVKVTQWEIVARIGFILSLVILGILLIPGIGKTVNGNTNWINLKFFDIQPSEFAKFFMILWAARLLARKENAGKFTFNVFKLLAPAFIVVMGLVLVGHDLGTSSVIAAILAGLLFISGIRLRILGWSVAAGALLLAYFIATADYRVKRFTVFLNPFAPEDYKFAGWQPAHSLLGLASGGL